MAKKRSRLWIGGAIAAVVVVGLAVTFWPRGLPVDLGAVSKGAMIQTVDEEARTRVAEPYVVAAPITGRLERVTLEAGDHVSAGQIVARMTPPELDERARGQAAATVSVAEAALQNARANARNAEQSLTLAESAYQRVAPLAGTGAVAPADIDRTKTERDNAKAAVDAANAAVNQQAASLAQARAALTGAGGKGGAIPIAAPVSGAVLSVAEKSVTTLAAGQPILQVGDVSGGMEVLSEVLSSEALEVSAGDRVILDVPASDTTLAGTVTRVEPAGFTKISALGVEEQRVNVIIALTTIPANLGAGYRLNARIVVWEDKAALSAPSSALFRHEGGWAVFRIIGGRARLTPVEVGHNNGTQAQILKGLADGDTVVLFPGPELSDGSRVRKR